MGASFELTSPQENYKLIAVTRNDFTDGAIRIEPPIQASIDELNRYVGDESGVAFSCLLSGREASTLQFEVPDDASETWIIGRQGDRTESDGLSDNEFRVRFAAEKLVRFLGEVEDKAFFVESNS